METATASVRWSDTLASPRVVGAAMLGAAAVLPLLPDIPTICPLRRLTGVPCPCCGMTTGVVATVHGDVVAGFSANPAAPLLVLVAVVALVLWVLRRPVPAVPPVVRTWGPVVAGVPMWAFQLHRFGFV